MQVGRLPRQTVPPPNTLEKKHTHTKKKKQTNQPNHQKKPLTTTMNPTHMEKTGSYKNHRQITSPCPPSRRGGVGSQCLLELVPEPAQFTQFGAQELQDVARCSVGDSSITLTSEPSTFPHSISHGRLCLAQKTPCRTLTCLSKPAHGCR